MIHVTLNNQIKCSKNGKCLSFFFFHLFFLRPKLESYLQHFEKSISVTCPKIQVGTILVKIVGTISGFSNFLHFNVDFSRSPKSRLVLRSFACFNIVWKEGGGDKGSEKRTRVAHITMEACTVNSLLFPPNLTSVPKSFGPDCRCTLICCLFATPQFQRSPN